MMGPDLRSLVLLPCALLFLLGGCTGELVFEKDPRVEKVCAADPFP